MQKIKISRMKKRTDIFFSFLKEHFFKLIYASFSVLFSIWSKKTFTNSNLWKMKSTSAVEQHVSTEEISKVKYILCDQAWIIIENTFIDYFKLFLHLRQNDFIPSSGRSRYHVKLILIIHYNLQFTLWHLKLH